MIERGSSGSNNTSTGAKQEDQTSKSSRSTTLSSSSSSSSSSQWSAFRNPRIVRVSRTFGGKDRHSKVFTVRGLRDRRIRLSVPTAIQLYDLQDRLGVGQPSKVIDWLIDNTKDDIDKLPPLHFPPSFATTPHHHLSSYDHYNHIMPTQHLAPFFNLNSSSTSTTTTPNETHHYNSLRQWDQENSSSSSWMMSLGKGTSIHHNDGVAEDDEDGSQAAAAAGAGSGGFFSGAGTTTLDGAFLNPWVDLNNAHHHHQQHQQQLQQQQPILGLGNSTSHGSTAGGPGRGSLPCSYLTLSNERGTTASHQHMSSLMPPPPSYRPLEVMMSSTSDHDDDQQQQQQQQLMMMNRFRLVSSMTPSSSSSSRPAPTTAAHFPFNIVNPPGHGFFHDLHHHDKHNGSRE